MRRTVAALAVLATTALAVLATTAPLPLVATPATPAQAAATRYVAVTVATLWTRPGIARPVDAPAVGNPVDLRRWLAGMTFDQRRWLVGRLETQARYGERVVVLQTAGAWTKVAVPSQPTPRNAAGYPGWVPTVQLTSRPPARTGRYGFVVAPTTWLYRSAAAVGSSRDRAAEVSFATRLPVLSATGAYVEVLTLAGSHLFAVRSAVAVRGDGQPLYPPGAARVVRAALMFRGLGYLWAGTSGFGFDCSGLTSTAYLLAGLALPRDADAQARAGVPVSRSALRPGDLLFFAGPGGTGTVHHVGMYVGNGQMVHAAATGTPVQVSAITAAPWRDEYAGARRYLSG